MARLLKAFLGLVAGAFGGAAAGALMLGLPTYLDDTCGFLGCARDWTPVAIYLGVIVGAPAGGAVGLIVGAAALSKRRACVAGACVGVLIHVSLLFMGAAGDAFVVGLGLAAIPVGALIGLAVAALLGPRSATKGEAPVL